MDVLAIDVGNSDVVLGLWGKGQTIPKTMRMNTLSIVENPNAFLELLSLVHEKWGPSDSVRLVMSSVVPMATKPILQYLNQFFNTSVKFLDQSQYHKLPLTILKPDEIGTDLVANALAAHSMYHTDSIIVDFGTAMSFTTIDKTGKIIGVSIAPGLYTAVRALTSNAAQLSDVQLHMPSSVLGQNTEHAIQSGIMFGYDGLVRGIISAQEKELNLRLNVVATGGLSALIHTLSDRVDDYQPHLTLEGLRLAESLI